METLSSFFGSRSYGSLKNFRRTCRIISKEFISFYVVLSLCMQLEDTSYDLEYQWNSHYSRRHWKQNLVTFFTSSTIIKKVFLNAFLEGASAGFLIRFATNIDSSYWVENNYNGGESGMYGSYGDEEEEKDIFGLWGIWYSWKH